MIENLTSGGIDNGSRPIWDARLDDAENDRDEARPNAGTRKDGIEVGRVGAIALSRLRTENIFVDVQFPVPVSGPTTLGQKFQMRFDNLG